MEVELRGAPDSVTLERVCFLAGPVLYKPSATMSAVGGIEVLRIRQYVNALTLLQKKGEAYFIGIPSMSIVALQVTLSSRGSTLVQ